MADFPVHPEAINPAWLSEVLGQPVTAVYSAPIGTGQVGDSYRLALEAPEASTAPRTLAAKLPAQDPTSRATAAAFSAYAREVGFYADVAPYLAVRVPAVHYLAIADDGVNFILLFEDLGPARAGNQIAGCSIADAEQAVRQAAAIHAPSWRRPDLLDIDWLQPRPELAARLRMHYPSAQAVWRERYADRLEPEFMQLCEALAEHVDLLFPGTPLPPVCLVHGDFRLDNLLFDIGGGAEPIAVLDWQTVAAGNPMTDIGYFLGCGIGNALREAYEDRLIDLWLAEMGRRGVKLTRAEIWDDYRRCALHGLTTAVFSAAFVERTERGDANFLSMARGACALALAHDSLGALNGEN